MIFQSCCLIVFSLTVSLPVNRADPTIQIELYGSDDGARKVTIVKCSVTGANGAPQIKLQYEELRGDVPYIKTLPSEGTILYAETVLPDDGLLVCTVTDQTGTYSARRDLRTQVCPDKRAIGVKPIGNVSRPAGDAHLNCYFRYPPGQLLYYTWTIKETNTPIYTYEAETGHSDYYQGTKYAGLSINETHLVTESKVNSTMKISVNMTDTNVYVCEVTLRKDYNNDCAGETAVRFEEPTLSITMYDAKTGSSDQSRVITCTVQHSAGEPTMNMFYVKPGGSMMHLKGAKSTLLAGASTTATLYGRVSDMDPSEGVILCNATDLRGNYSVEKRRGNEECPHANMLTVKQSKPVHRPGGVVQLTCNMMVGISELRSYSWMFAGNKSLIYSNMGFRGTDDIVSGNVTTSSSGGRVTSVLSTKISGNDANTLRCTFVTRQNQNCSSVHTVVFEEQISSASSYSWVAIAFAVCVLLVLICTLLYACKRLRRYQNSRKPLQACTQPLIQMKDIGNYGKQDNIKGQWGKAYATRTNISGKKFKVQHDDILPIRGLEVCKGGWNNANVCGGFRVQFDTDQFLTTPNFNDKDIEAVLPFSGATYIAGIQVRDGHMIDQLTIFSGPCLEAHKFGFNQGGELQPFESHGYLVGIRGEFIEKKGEEELSYGLANVQFRWKSSGAMGVAEQNNVV